MAISKLLPIFFLLSIFITKPSSAKKLISTPLKCGISSPEIRPQQLDLRGFNLSCSRNKMMIHFSNYADLLVVKSISYDSKKLDLLDPNNCVHGVFLNLNLSSTPFNYYHVLKPYRYINCSSKLESPFVQVPCLSSSTYHVYTVEPSSEVPVSCISVKIVPIPFLYSPYLSDDNSFGLELTWNTTELRRKMAHQKYIRALKALCTVVGFLALIFTVGMFSWATISQYCKEFTTVENMDNTYGELEVLHGKYEIIN